ncbi:hypothetical protein EPA93_32260 [Ktedonosporobacter rubrisoli]|uniref:Uncharacterized protein n=1 Tax=Ktedonosporobacter rubrisoli TaxID=2509675 RepID=A0A4P6JZ82_KTERU|nr:hypothetical protein EPA93_32260 [Ktedonosporobacter rubrisoli]
MILPTKRLGPERAMITIGAEILGLLMEPKTVSRLWNELSHIRGERSTTHTISYDWFVLTLDLLYMLGSIEMDHGKIRRVRQ